ncbi:MAG: hypothetical protein KAR20_19390, partial [Candidatus Heimdallarchaeota archaeon]|nr:hypothetical protein [Candidatus Heimdallarchaeota archaeon]
KKKIPFFRENYRILLAAFALAVLLWVVVTTDKEYTMRLEVPFSISRVANNYILSERPPSKVVMNVTGNGRALFSLYFIKTSIDLELPEINRTTTIQLKDYQKRFHIASELGIKITDIVEPKSIRLKVDRYAEMKKPIIVLSKIGPMPGYIFVGMNVDFDSTIVSGPLSILNSINYIYSDTISKSGLKYPFRSIVKLQQPKPGITGLSPSSVNINFNIEELVERPIYNIPIQILSIPPEFLATAIPPTVTIRVRGAESKVAALSGDQITAVFDYQKYYKTGKMEYPIVIEIPQNITLLETLPNSFRLQLKRREDL